MKKLNPYSQLLIRMSLVLFIVAGATFLNRTDATARAESAGKGLEDSYVVRNPDENAPGAPQGGAFAEADSNRENGNSRYENAGKKTEFPGDAASAGISEDPGKTDIAAGSDVNRDNFGNGENSAEPVNTDSGNDKEPGGSGIGNGSEPADPGTGNASEGPDGTLDNNPNDGSGVEGDGDDDFDIQDPDNVQNANVPLSEEELKAIAEAEEAKRLAEYKKSQEYINTLLVTHPDHYNAAVVESAKSLPLASDNDRYRYITGKDKKVYKVGGMPEGYRNDSEAKTRMVTLDVPVWKMKNNGEKYSSYWPITINEKLADSIRCIFSDIYLLDIKFPFNYLIGYSFRKVGGVGLVNSKLMSTHAFGVALDINLGDFDNDYFLGKGNDLRNKKNPYCIPDEVIRIFESYGWFWGGNYEICADTMHFQYFELGFLKYDSDEPFPILSRNAEDMDPKVIRNLTQRLVKLGYLEKETTNFSRKVDRAVKKFQEEHGLEADGVVDYATWEPLINLTHYMAYVF